MKTLSINNVKIPDTSILLKYDYVERIQITCLSDWINEHELRLTFKNSGTVEQIGINGWQNLIVSR